MKYLAEIFSGNLKDKQVLLTGGTGGLGLGVTPTVLRQGANIIIPHPIEGAI